MPVDSLLEFGYTVIQATNANKALEQFTLQPQVDLLFTDIVIPDINGRALAMRPNLKVLLTTGYTRNEVVHNGILDAAKRSCLRLLRLSSWRTSCGRCCWGNG